jgi:hypothetical protein
MKNTENEGLTRRRRPMTRAAMGLAAGAALTLAGAGSAWAVPIDPGQSPCLSSTGTLTGVPSTTFLGLGFVATWSTDRPADCGVASELSGPGIPGGGVVGGVGGSQTVFPPNVGVNTYTVTVFYPGGHVAVATASVNVVVF